MKVMTMLALDAVDLGDLVMALEDNDYESSWWIDPKSGQIEYCTVDDDPEDFEGRGLVAIDPMGSRAGYDIMADFVGRIRASRPRDLLDRAIQGRGAFRRFKDTLFEFPELRQEWFAFHDRAMHRHALTWLGDTGLVETDEIERALTDLGPDDDAPLGPEDVAALAAAQLRNLYGKRLVDVVVFGSHARGDADDDSDLDLLIVLDGEVAPFEELRRMDEILWQLTFAHGITVSALPVSRDTWDRGSAAVLVEVRNHGIPVK